MLIDLGRETVESLPSADVVIVGAGAVGLTLAVELSSRGLSVLVLEAGGNLVTAESQAFFTEARAVGRPSAGLHIGRYRALGGTTNFWGGQLIPLDPLIYSHRPWVSADRWPIGHADVEPYHARVFELLGMQQQVARDADVWQRLGVDAPLNTAQIEFIFTRWTPEPNFSRLYAQAVQKSSTLTVAVNAPVTALQTNAAGDRIEQVLLNVGGRRVAAPRASFYVLANGAIEAPRLLLCPLADARTASWSRNAWLGRGFTDHLECKCAVVTPIDARRFHNLFDNVVLDGIKYQPKIKLTDFAQSSRQLLSGAASFTFHSSLTEHLDNAKIFFKAAMRGQFKWDFFRYPGRLLSLARVSAPMIGRYLRDRRVYNVADRGIDLNVMVEQRPVMDSSVRLREQRDSLGMPMVDLDWRVDGAELGTIAALTSLIDDYLTEQQLGSLAIKPQLAERDPAFLLSGSDTYHHIGTTRMSRSPQAGVVDETLRVHGCGNLYVAGASVYPTGGFQNPTFTAMALGLRLADTLIALSHAASKPARIA